MNSPSFRLVFCATVALAVNGGYASDLDNDGVDDAIDVCCETPEWVAVDSSGRPIGDLDGDCDIDLVDYMLLQNGFFGPGGAGCCFDTDCDDADPCTVDSCEFDTGVCSFVEVPGCGDCVIDESCPAELLCDVPVVGEISSPTETDTLCFCVAEGELVRISVIEQPGAGSGFGPTWRLVDAWDNPAPSCGSFVTAVAGDCGPLPAAGSPYRLVIEDGSRNDVGMYKANLQRLRAARACDDAEVTCDVPTALSISDSAEEDLASFTVKDGELVRVSVVEAVGLPSGFGVSWRLIDGLGHAALSCGAFASSVDRDCGPLFASGNPYRVEIEDGSRNEVGDYSVYVQRLTATASCEGTSLACGVPIQEAIETIGDSDLFNFRVTDDEIVRISLREEAGQPANFNPSWRLVDGYGFAAVSCGSFSSSVTGVDCGPLPASRNPYRIEVQDGTRNDIGVYHVALDRLVANRACDQVELVCGQAELGVIATPEDVALFLFNVAEGETVRVSVFEQAGSGAGFGPTWRLVDAAGRPAPVCGNFVTSTSIDCGPLPTARSPYRVEVEDQGHNDVGTVTVTVDFLTSGCP